MYLRYLAFVWINVISTEQVRQQIQYGCQITLQMPFFEHLEYLISLCLKCAQVMVEMLERVKQEMSDGLWSFFPEPVSILPYDIPVLM